MRCGFFHNDSGQLLIFRGIVIVVSSSAMAVQNTIHGRIQNFRIFFGQPCRRCRCRSTKDYFHTHFRCCIQKSVKEIIVENTFVPLNLTPCKLCDSDHLDTVFQHSSQIIPPKALIPVFRVITGSQYQSFAIYNLHRILLLLIYVCCLRDVFHTSFFNACASSVLFFTSPSITKSSRPICCVE